MQYPPHESIANFLWNFDCVFTLNQDSLAVNCGKNAVDKKFKHQREESVKLEIQSQKSYVPYIELHGSYDWDNVFILGTCKSKEIENKPRIGEFFNFFEQSLNEKNSKIKLVIIGYSFNDEHINELIKKGIDNNLEWLIWDPNALEINERLVADPDGYNDPDYVPCRGLERINIKALKSLAEEFSVIKNNQRSIESVIEFLNS